MEASTFWKYHSRKLRHHFGRTSRLTRVVLIADVQVLDREWPKQNCTVFRDIPILRLKMPLSPLEAPMFSNTGRHLGPFDVVSKGLCRSWGVCTGLASKSVICTDHNPAGYLAVVLKKLRFRHSDHPPLLTHHVNSSANSTKYSLDSPQKLK